MRARALLVSLSACLAMSGVVQAGSVVSQGKVNLRYLNCSPAGFATIHRDGINETVWTGQYNLQLDPSYVPHSPADATNHVYDAASNFVIGTFCCDVREDAPVGSAYVSYDIIMPETAPLGAGSAPMGSRANDLRRLYGAYGSTFHDGVNDNAEAAAFELCVWEIVFETGSTYNLSAGSFYATATWTTSWVPTAVVGTANTWLDSLKAMPVPNVPLRVLANDGLQDYAFMVPGVDDPRPLGHAPEPLTMLSLILGAGSVAGYIRKRKQTGCEPGQA
jgi:hypothetical protein